MKRRVAAALTVAGVAWGILATPASARVVGSLPYQPFQAPVPVGDRGVAWLDDARVFGPWTLWTANYGAKARRVQRFVSVGDVAPGDFVASATHVALRVVVPAVHNPAEPPPYEDVRILAGAFGQPLQQVAGCRIGQDNPALRLLAGPFQLHDSTLLFARGDGCRDLVERDLALGASSDRPLARPGVFEVREAGRFVAWLEYDPSAPVGSATAAVVQDRATGREVTRVPLSRPEFLSLSDDGTLAISLGPTIMIAEPGAVAARELAIRVSPSDAPVPWVGRYLAVASSGSPTTQQLIDTNGTVVRRLVETLPDLSASINDTHVVWLTRGCNDMLISARPLSAPGTVHYLPDHFRCRLQRAGPTVLTARRLRLGVSCKSFALGCSAAVTVRVGKTMIAKGDVSYGYRHETAARDTLPIRLNARRLLRARTSVKLQITAQYTLTDSIRRTTVTVRRR